MTTKKDRKLAGFKRPKKSSKLKVKPRSITGTDWKSRIRDAEARL